MKQLYNRFFWQDVSIVLDEYRAGRIKLKDALRLLQIKERRFYMLLKRHRDINVSFWLVKKRQRPSKLTDQVNIFIKQKLGEQNLQVRRGDRKRINYSEIKKNIKSTFNKDVSLPTIIERAKNQGYYKSNKQRFSASAWSNPKEIKNFEKNECDLLNNRIMIRLNALEATSKSIVPEDPINFSRITDLIISSLLGYNREDYLRTYYYRFY